jgi:hypothetical protein
MSQSDYIRYKKVSTELAGFSGDNRPPVLLQSDLLTFQEFNLENKTVNTKTVRNCITPVGSTVVFGMVKTPSSKTCGVVFDCSYTNLLPNRVPLSGVYFTTRSLPLDWNKTKNAKWQKSGCICALGRSYTDKYICKCKTAV